MPSSTAVFRAVADFASLNREVKSLRREFVELKAEAADTGAFKSFDSALARTAKAQASLRRETATLSKSRKDLAKAERVLAEDIGRSTKARRDATAPTKSYERSLTSTEQAMSRLHETQKKARQSTDSLTLARSKAVASFGRASDELSSLTKAENDAVSSARKHAEALKRERDAADSKLATLSKLSAFLNDLVNSEGQAADGSDRHADALGREAHATEEAGRAHHGHNTALNQNRQASLGAAGATNQFNTSVRQSGPASNSSRSGISSLGQTLRDYAKSADRSRGRSHALRNALLLLIIPVVTTGLQVLIGAVVALGGALVGVLGALGPAVSGLAALGPVALTAAGAIGTVLLAFRGVKDALKAQDAAQKAAATSSSNSAQEQLQNARRIRDAQEAVTAALKDRARAIQQADRDVAAAEKDVARAHDSVRAALADLNAEREKAIRDLEDYNNAAKDAALSVEAAEIDLIEAQQNQLKVAVDVKATDLDRRKAALQVAQAEQRLSEAKLDNARSQVQLNTANQQGVDGAPGVVAAQNQIAESQQGVRDAQQSLTDAKAEAAERIAAADEMVMRAERSLHEAYEDIAVSSDKASAAQTNLASAMEKLSPAGVAFVNYLRSLKPLIDGLSKSAQEALFPGLQKALEIIMPMINTVAIPTVTAFGAVLSKLAIDGATDLRSFEKDFLDFGTGDGPVLMDKFGHTLLNLAAALEDIVMAAMPLAQWLADLALKFSQYVRDTVNAARESGRLAKYFNRVKDTLKLLGDILFNIGGILRKVFEGAAPMGRRLLETFRDVTGETNKYLHTAEGMAKVKKYFDDLEPSARVVLSLLTKMVGAILGIGASRNTYEFLKLIQDRLVPALTRMSEAFSKIAGPIGERIIDLFANFADILTELFDAGGTGLEAFIAVLQGFSEVLLFIVRIPGMDKIGSWLLAIAAGLAAIKLVGKIPGIGAVGRGLNRLAGGAAVAATGAVVTKDSPATFAKGAAAGLGGAGTTASTATGRIGQALGSGVRTVASVTPGVRRFVGPVPAAPVVPTATPSTVIPPVPPRDTHRPQPVPRTVPRPSAPVEVESKGPVTVKSTSSTPPAVQGPYVGFADDKPAPGLGRQLTHAAASTAGAFGGSVAGGAIGQKLGGDTGAMVGSIAGGLAGSFAPDALAAGLAKVGPLLQTVRGGIADAVTALAGFVTKANLAKVATEAWAIAQKILNVAMRANPIGIIITIIGLLVAAFIYAWENSETFRNIVMGVLQAVGDFFVWVWDTLIKPVVDFFVAGFHMVGDAAMWLWERAIKPALDFIADGLGWLWNNIGKPIVDHFVAGLRQWGDIAMWLWEKAIKPAIDGIGAALSWTYENIIKPIFDAFMWVVDLLAKSFQRAIDFIKVAWDRLGDIAKVPVNFVIDWVYNRGIVPMWNRIAGLFGLGQLQPAALLAEGGVLSGYAPGRDSVPAVLSPGEGVLVPEAVRGLGPDFVYEANEYFSRGRARGGRRAQRFAEGGVVGDVAGAIATMVTDPVGSIKRLFSNVLGAVIPGTGTLREAMVKVPIRVVDAIVEKAKEYAAKAMAAVGFGDSGGGVVGAVGSGVERWRAVSLQALGIAGQDPGNIGRLLMQMSTESGGNPYAINRYDINWQKGTPSVGLMQVIGPTYASYRHPNYNAAPFEYGVSEDPLSNILSSIRYTTARYGSLARGWQGHGYAKGGLVSDAFGNFPAQRSRQAKVSLGRSPHLRARSGDSVAAMLTPGEFVLNRKAVDFLGLDKLEKLNNASVIVASDLFTMLPPALLPHFALGGVVDGAFNSSVTHRGGDVTNAGSHDRDITINTNIYNPTAEPASDSVASRMRTLSQMGAFS